MLIEREMRVLERVETIKKKNDYVAYTYGHSILIPLGCFVICRLMTFFDIEDRRHFPFSCAFTSALSSASFEMGDSVSFFSLDLLSNIARASSSFQVGDDAPGF